MIKRALIFSLIFTLLIAVVVFFLFDSVAVRDLAKRLIISQAYYKLNLKVDVDTVRLSYFRPAVIIEKFTLNKEEGDTNINLFAPKAVIRFNPFKLIRGDFSVSGLQLQSPNLYLEIKSSDKPLELKDININKILGRSLGAKLDKVEIENANLRVKIKNPDNKEIEISTPKISISLKKGIVSNFILRVTADNISCPIEYLSSVDLEIDIKKDLLKVEKFNAGFVGGKLASNGTVSNLTDVSNLKLDLFWRLNLNLDESRKYSKILKIKEDYYYPRGLLVGSGRLSGYAFKDLKNSNIDGNIKIKGFRWFTYDIPQIEITAKYSRDQISISKLDVSDGSKSITVQDSTISLQSPYPVKGKGIVNDIELSRYLEMFNLKHCLSYFNIGGPFTFTGSIKPELKISALFDLKIRDFWVLKKKGLLPNKDNSILDFKNGSVYGFVHFSAKGAYFDNFVAKSESNTMVVSGWIRDVGTVDLDVNSDSFSMNTYGRLGALPIKGAGALKTRLIVDDNGDFLNDGSISFKNVELLDSYYIGDVNSKVIYDGKVLFFKDIKGKLGNSNYVGYNEIHFDKDIGPTIKGYGTVIDGYSEDVYSLFKKQEKWTGSPSGIIGAAVKFEGYPSWPAIKLDSRLKIKNGEFFSERFDELIANFTWNKGDLNITDLYVTKGKGRLDFKGLRKEKELKLDVSSKNLSLADFALVSKRNIEVNGNLDVKGGVDHHKDSLDGNIKFNLSDLNLAGQKLKPVAFNLDLGDKVNLKFNLFDKEASGELRKEGENTYVLKSKFTKFNFHPVGVLLLKNIDNFKTEVDGEVEIKFVLPLIVKSAKVKISNVSLSNSAISLKNKDQVVIDYENERYTIAPFSIITESDNNKCSMNFDSDGQKNILIKGCVTTGVLKLFKDYIAAARGKFDLDLSYDNKLKGVITPKDVEIITSEQRLGSFALTGKILLENNLVKLDSLNVSTGGANIIFSGDIDVDKLVKLQFVYPGVKLSARVDKFYFEYPEGLKGKWSGDISINGSTIPYKVSGTMSLFESSYRKDIDFGLLSVVNSSKSKNVFSINKKEQPKFNLDIKVKSSDEVYVRNLLFNGQLVFDLNVKGTEKDPKIVGSIDLLRGTITYLDNVFDLTAGRFKFKEDTSEPPVYQLDGESKIGDYQVYLKLVSEKGEPRFKLTSTPPLTEDKILALMATGDVQTDFTEGAGYGMAAGAGGQAFTEGLGVTSAFKKRTGVGFRVKPPKAKDSSVPDVELQKDLTDDLKVIYGKSLGNSLDETTKKQEVNVQYEVNKNVQLKLLLEEEVKKEDVSNQPTNAGVDLNFKFEF